MSTSTDDFDSPADILDSISSEQQERLSQLLDQYLSNLEQGLATDIAGLKRQHPDLADALDAYVASLEFLHAAAQESRNSFAGDRVHGAAGLPETTRRLGDFQLLRELGRGGMGVVYEAIQESLGRRVALKVLPWGVLSDPRQTARFRKEAQAAAQLQHPHVVSVYAVGQDQGVHYYAMQFIDGHSLSDLLDRLDAARKHNWAQDSTAPSAGASQPVDALVNAWLDDPARYFRAIAGLGIDAAQGLHAAHQCGIVHRDIKPSNLLLDQDGKLWVTDFGLARSHADEDLTLSGDLIGTLRYMSPEQARGGHALHDPRIDVFSLGATLYELLTLHAAASDEYPALLHVLDRREVRPMRALDARIPADLETIISKAMAHAPEDRYATAEQLATDLQRFLEGRTLIARRPSLGDRIIKWARRRQQMVVATLLVLSVAVMALSVCVGALIWQIKQTQAALADARTSRREYLEQLARTENHLAMLRHEHGDDQQAIESLKRAIRLQRQRVQEAPGDALARRLLADQLGNLAMIQKTLDPHQALASYQEALEIQTDLYTQAPDAAPLRDLALTLGNLGALQYQLQQFEAAVDSLYKALAHFMEARSANDSAPLMRLALAVTYNNLGRALHATGNSADAEVAFHRALDVFDGLAPPGKWSAEERCTLASTHHNLARLLEEQQESSRALAEYETAIHVQQSAAADGAPQGEALLKEHYFGAARAAKQVQQWSKCVEYTLAAIYTGKRDPLQWVEAAQLIEDIASQSQASPGYYDRREAYRQQALGLLQEAFDQGLRLQQLTAEQRRDLRLSPTFGLWLAAHQTNNSTPN